ncbi:MAG: hypothetical protein KA319_01290 [Ferruginibacter sp.]|nr:hypothetical protein [Ferruginibacter sp.]
MDNTTLYPELIDYIFEYQSKFMTKNEKAAQWHGFAMEKSENGSNKSLYNFFKERNLISFDKEVLALLKFGFKDFKEKVATRIFKEHKDELELNTCPKCNKIARTTLAKQCRFCHHDWH